MVQYCTTLPGVLVDSRGDGRALKAATVQGSSAESTQVQYCTVVSFHEDSSKVLDQTVRSSLGEEGSRTGRIKLNLH